MSAGVAVEFALILPVLMILLLGIIEFSYAFLVQASVSNAARLGVRNYAINYTAPGAQQAAIDLARSALTPGARSPAFSAPCTPMGQTTLTLTYRYRSITGWFDGILGSQVSLKGIGSMQCGG
ncbi:MAG: TadE/TadG family type IV pilus assembly protein [Propionicimonas sp.]